MLTYPGAFGAALPLVLVLSACSSQPPAGVEPNPTPETTGIDATTDAILEESSEGADAGSTADSGGMSADAGDMAPDAMECNLVRQQAAPITPSCPTTDPDGGISMNTWLGGTVVDGTYVMTSEVVWESACGALASTEARATLEVHGGTMALVAYGPNGLFAPSSTTRFSFTYSGSGASRLSVTQTCPSTGQLSFSVAYTAGGNQLALSGLNGLLGVATFTRL